MGEGQTHGAGPAAVLPYALGHRELATAEWRDLAEGIEFQIPPPPVWRQVVPPAVGLVVAIPVAFLLGAGTVAAAPKAAVVGTLLLGAVTLGAVAWALSASRRLVRAAKHGFRPTVISTSAEWLTLVSPWLPEDRPYQLPRRSITGVRLDEVNVLPAVVRSVRLSVVLRHEDVFHLKFPWRADFSLAHAEWGLRDALGLGRRNFAPPVASAGHGRASESSS